MRTRAPRSAGPPRVASVAVVLVALAALLTLLAVPAVVSAAGVVEAIDEQVLDFPPLPPLDELAERSVVLDRDGEELAVLRAENRVLVQFDELPDHLVDAVVATEDNRFFTHRGVNWRGALRAAVGNARDGEISSGGSGITQQLVKNLVVGNRQTYSRKLQEAWYALELEQRMSKEEILTAYLNEAYLANNVYGVGAAAEFYWGRDVTELDLPQAATLAGMLRAPELNDPVDDPDMARARRDIVLRQMAEQGRITAAEAERAAATDLDLDLHRLPEPEQPFLAAYVRAILDAEPSLGFNVEERRRAYERGGLEIHTTLDADLQRAATRIISARTEGVTNAPLGAIAAVDPRDGAILTVAVGPKEFGSGDGRIQVNPAVPGAGGGGRQAGSAFKAFEVVAALEAGIPPTYRVDTPSPYEPTQACADTGWAPTNYSGDDSGTLDMVEATAASSNSYFAHLVDRTGPEQLAGAARRMGITSTLDVNCTLVLGTSDVFPLEMAAAFGTLAADGLRCAPSAISEIRDASGRVVSQPVPGPAGGCERTLDEGVARQATDLLQGPVESGTAQAAAIGRPAAGKTGTTQDHTDAWFVGYIPQLSVAAWMGPEEPARMEHPTCSGGVTGGCLPARMWHDFMTIAVDALDIDEQDFPAPPPLPTAQIPDVVGRDLDRARASAERLGFAVEIERVDGWRPEGTVTGSTPAPGAEAPRGGVVNLQVSNGDGDPPVVPDVRGRSRAAAEQALGEVGIDVDVVTVPVTDAGQYGVVVDHTPAPGEPAVSPLRRRLIRATLQVGRPVRAGEVPRTFTAGPGE